MEAHWILLGLLSLVSVSSCQECNKQLLENTIFQASGQLISPSYSPSVQHCQLKCTQHPSCMFFTFIPPDSTGHSRHFYCHLLSSESGEPTIVSRAPGIISGYSLKSCPPPHESCLSEFYQNTHFGGVDYKSLFTVDHQECQRACTYDPGCQFFTYANERFFTENTRYKCQLKFSSISPVIEHIFKEFVVSGFSNNSLQTPFWKSECTTRIFPHTEIPGKNVWTNLKAISAEHCQYLCSVHPLCTYFSFYRESFKCHLKKDENSMVFVAKVGVTSGLPTRFCQPPTDWVNVAHEGVLLSGSGFRYELVDDAHTCHRTCTDDPNCQYYTYYSPTSIVVSHRRRCILKRGLSLPLPPQIKKLSNVVSGFALRNCGVQCG